ncbi:MAG: sulfotransferase domain-containing protein [Schleiferiaceae bacterium]
MKSAIFPNLVVGGAPKCGTSSVFFWLAAHPEVASSREKETFFWAPEVNRFNAKCNVVEHGPEAYPRLFEHTSDAKVRFEATAAYIYYSTAWEGLASLPVKPTVLFLLREPAARTQSQFLFETHRTGRVNGSFADYIREPHILDHGHYVRYLTQWEAALGRENLVIWQFEQVMRDPRAAMMSLAERLGIDPTFYERFDFAVRNETVAIRSKGLHRLGLRLQSMIPLAVQDALLPLYLKLNGAGRPKADDRLKAETKALKPLFAASNAELAARFPESIDLALWA